MENEKSTNYTKEEIQKYLDNLNEAIENKRIDINVDRDKNNKFITDYALTEKRQINILKQLTVDDFCYTVMNTNTNYPEVPLYIFTKEYTLDYFSEEEKVIVYIKFYIVLKRCQEYGTIISFHETDNHERRLFLEI